MEGVEETATTPSLLQLGVVGEWQRFAEGPGGMTEQSGGVLSVLKVLSHFHRKCLTWISAQKTRNKRQTLTQVLNRGVVKQ